MLMADSRLSSLFQRLRGEVKDGGLKIAQDALCEALSINDNRITEIHLYKQRDPIHPRIEVTLIPVPCRS